jgi:hypothetical protein
MSDGLKAALVEGAVTGGGLTVIANAPNPAGQSILNRYFEDGIRRSGCFGRPRPTSPSSPSSCWSCEAGAGGDQGVT